MHSRATQASPASWVASAASTSAADASGKSDDLADWTRRGVPVYLQSSFDFDVCDESLSLSVGKASDLLWSAIR